MSSIFTISNGHVSVFILLGVFTVFDRVDHSLLDHSVLVAPRRPCSVVFLPTLTVPPQSLLLVGFLFSNSQWWIVLGLGLRPSFLAMLFTWIQFLQLYQQ